MRKLIKYKKDWYELDKEHRKLQKQVDNLNENYFNLDKFQEKALEVKEDRLIDLYNEKNKLRKKYWKIRYILIGQKEVSYRMIGIT